MSEEKNNRPWRRDPEVGGLLDSGAAGMWGDLLTETQRSVAELRGLSGVMDEKIQQGRAVVEALEGEGARVVDAVEVAGRMEKMEARLALLERAVGQLVAHMPEKRVGETGEEDGADRVETFEHLLGAIRSEAA